MRILLLLLSHFTITAFSQSTADKDLIWNSLADINNKIGPKKYLLIPITIITIDTSRQWLITFVQSSCLKTDNTPTKDACPIHDTCKNPKKFLFTYDSTTKTWKKEDAPALTPYLKTDTEQIVSGLSVTYTEWYPYYLKVDKEVKDPKVFNDTTTVHYVQMVLTSCMKAEQAGIDTMNQDPEKCPPLSDELLINGRKKYQYIKIVRTKTTTPTKTTFYKGHTFGSLAALQQADE